MQNFALKVQIVFFSDKGKKHNDLTFFAASEYSIGTSGCTFHPIGLAIRLFFKCYFLQKYIKSFLCDYIDSLIAGFLSEIAV